LLFFFINDIEKPQGTGHRALPRENN